MFLSVLCLQVNIPSISQKQKLKISKIPLTMNRCTYPPDVTKNIKIYNLCIENIFTIEKISTLDFPAYIAYSVVLCEYH